jgi:hypothetical protein
VKPEKWNELPMKNPFVCDGKQRDGDGAFADGVSGARMTPFPH